MTAYLARRTLGALLSLLAISVIIFIILQMTPGGPFAVGEAARDVSAADVDRLRGRYGLDDPLPLQYLKWLGGVVTGDWGESYRSARPVLDVLVERLPTTLTLAVSAFVVSLLLAVPLGVLAAYRQYSKLDYTASAVAFAGFATPGFWLAIMLIYVFSFRLGWLPSSGLQDLREQHTGLGALVDRIRHMILPVTVLALIATANLMRHVRGAMLEVLDQDYIRTARGSGLPERTVLLRHGLRNASIPIVTVAVLTIPELFLGTVITETVFGLSGMGRLFVESAGFNDYPVLLGALMIGALLFVVANLLADLGYAALDPKIRYT